jgi:hypothetical protein
MPTQSAGGSPAKGRSEIEPASTGSPIGKRKFRPACVDFGVTLATVILFALAYLFHLACGTFAVLLLT